jgi:hypothetical protein
LEILQEFDIKFKKYDKKRTLEGQLNDLLTVLKQMKLKIIDNSKFNLGFGEGVCLILNQLLDKYLMNQNFIFVRPKFIDKNSNKIDEIANDFEEVLLEENLDRINSNDKIKTQNGFTGNNFTTGTRRGFYSGKKRFNSAISNRTQGMCVLLILI